MHICIDLHGYAGNGVCAYEFFLGVAIYDDWLFLPLLPITPSSWSQLVGISYSSHAVRMTCARFIINFRFQQLVLIRSGNQSQQIRLIRVLDQLVHLRLLFQLTQLVSYNLHLVRLTLKKLLQNCRGSWRIFIFHSVNMLYFQTISLCLILKRTSLALEVWELLWELIQAM